jgi:hypothetical protein
MRRGCLQESIITPKHNKRTTFATMAPAPQYPDNMVGTGIEAEDETGAVLHSPRTLRRNSFELESGSWSIVDGEILRLPKKNRKGGKRVVEGGIMTDEGDALDVVFENVEAFACNEKIPDRPPKGVPPTIKLSNSLVDEDYALTPMVESSCRGAGTKTCTSNHKLFYKRKRDDRNALSRLGGAKSSEEVHPGPDPQEITQTVVVKNRKQKRDVLDFVFEHVEAFLCRDKQPKQVDADLKRSGTDDSSPIKLHPITPKPEPEEDMLDYVCNGVEGFACREEGDNYVGPQQEDLEAGIPTPKTKIGVNVLREHSLLDLEPSLDTPPTGSDSDDDSISRLQELRNKKRNIESQIRSSSTEPGILVPKGYAGKSATPKAKPELAPDVLAEQERKERFKEFKKKFMALVIVFFFLAALVVVGISFFLSPTF